MLVFDAFRAFNSSNSGLLTCSELYGGLDYLGIPFSAEDIYDLVRKLSITNEGLVSYQDFHRVFKGQEDELESRVNHMMTADGDNNNYEPIPPHPIPELVDLTSKNNDDLPDLNADVLQYFKIRVKQVSGLSLVWDSQGTHSQYQVSIWTPVLPKSMLSNKVGLCLGHFANRGLSNPLKGRNTKRLTTIEVVDNATIRMKRSKTMQAVLQAAFPHPLRFKQTWHLSREGINMFAWRPIPPDDFVSMGIICTVTEDPPDVKSVYCVPKSWVKPSVHHPLKIWDDVGSGGGKPGSIWLINSMDMIDIVPGHNPPEGEYYEFAKSRYNLDGFSINVHKDH